MAGFQRQWRSCEKWWDQDFEFSGESAKWDPKASTDFTGIRRDIHIVHSPKLDFMGSTHRYLECTLEAVGTPTPGENIQLK